MFDIGFAELMLIGLIALIVIGPKRLPEAARFLGYWTGKLRRTIGDARQEMEREFGIDEIKREVHNSLLLEQLAKERQSVEGQFKRATDDVASPIEGAISEARHSDTNHPNIVKEPTEDDFLDDDFMADQPAHERSVEPDLSPETDLSPEVDTSDNSDQVTSLPDQPGENKASQ